jgi:peptidyl-prolyl cis-trans isomerase C
MKRLLREPLVHFVLIGTLIFSANSWRNRGAPSEEGLPAIEISADTIAWLGEGFAKQWHRPPDDHELRGLVEDHVREEVLYREALAMGLDRNDTIVRRRMAQKVQFLGEDLTGAVPLDDASLKRYFADHEVRYAQPGRTSFRHVFFSRDRRGATLETDARAALPTLAEGGDEMALGDPFLREHEFIAADEREIAGALGDDFVARLFNLPIGNWQGPVASVYGVHLVLVTAREEARPVAFESVRDAVARDLAEDRRITGNHEFVERLKARYRIHVDEAALDAGANVPATTATR